MGRAADDNLLSPTSPLLSPLLLAFSSPILSLSTPLYSHCDVTALASATCTAGLVRLFGGFKRPMALCKDGEVRPYMSYEKTLERTGAIWLAPDEPVILMTSPLHHY